MIKDQKSIIIGNALNVAKATRSDLLFVFLNDEQSCRWFMKASIERRKDIVVVIPKELELKDSLLKNCCHAVLRSWSGSQTRFSRIKYAFLQGVINGIITTSSKLVCVLGPYDKGHLDTITIHDLAYSWSEEFPFDINKIIEHRAFYTIMAVLDIALDIGALGREGKSVGTIFVIGDSENVMNLSHQVVFNPFKGYPKREKMIRRPEVVESIKELAKLDGAFVISEDGYVEAAGRFLEGAGMVSKKLRGFGARHRSAVGITRKTQAVAIVVSESTGKVTIFEDGQIVATLEPLISRRMV